MYNPITETEIKNELNSRGYFQATTAQPPHTDPDIPPINPPNPDPPVGFAALLANKVFMSILIGTILTFFE